MVCVTYTLSNSPSSTATHTHLPSLSSLQSRFSLSSFHFSSVLLSNNTILLPLSLSAILPSLLTSWLFSYSLPPFSYLVLCSASNTGLQILDSLIKMHIFWHILFRLHYIKKSANWRFITGCWLLLHATSPLSALISSKMQSFKIRADNQKSFSVILKNKISFYTMLYQPLILCYC